MEITSDSIKNQAWHLKSRNNSTVEKQSMSNAVYYSSVVASMSSMLFGVSLTIMGSMHSRVMSVWSSTMNDAEMDTRWGHTSGAIFLGCLVSNIAINMYKPNFKMTLRMNNFLYALGYLSFLISQSFVLVFFGRFILGLASGIACAVVSPYISMIAPEKNRGFLLSFHSLGIIVGITLGNVLACINGMRTWWIPSCIAIIIASLNFIVLNGVRDPRLSRSEASKSVIDLLEKRCAKRSIFLAVLVHISQHLSGVDYITLFLRDLFSNGKYMYSADTMTILASLFSVFTTIIFANYVDKVGRKPMIIISSMVISISTTMLTMNMYPAIAALLFMLGYNLGLSSIPWFITAEIFPLSYSSPAGLLAVSLNWISAYGILAIFYPLHKAHGNIVFSFYTVCMLVFIGLIICFFKETRNRTPGFQ
ncbi:putative glucose transporter [Ordospora colligata]|uniref:Putative glucose transporter n=1 Tax=Ordospora colligata OC4 TaxID=1354746 RepID=A0A0B2UFL9_9MICR|nr:putative glucose transporter [Ordospora colligata OC4]KHN69871.1 putative glucose transporter [Ordospora colligata OC4]TBU16041.1 putative glucose transporter [Ordospora colligata]TBU16254.1 putative glucose transporter [Ordospora colligata]TBU18958.1 putative glucose transporter [Ordospora colligata]